jgi:radical SAM superfamily enzyme YgiQ (UPF0313 family)
MTSSIYKKAVLVASAQVQYSRPPAALAFLSGMCDHCDLPNEVIDLNIEILNKYKHDIWFQMHKYLEMPMSNWPQNLQDLAHELLEQVCKDIKNQQPDLVAITVLTYMQHVWTYELVKHLRTHLPNVTVIIGGPGVAAVAIIDPQQREIKFGRFLIEQDLIDYFVIGEGELVFEQFLKGQTNLPGLNSALTEDNWQPQLDNIDGFPLPSYKKINLDHYRSPEGSTRIIITGSRGCVRKCTFCDIEYHWPKYRYRNGANVAEEILCHHKDTGITNFWFNDSLINGSLKNFREMLELLRNHRLNYDSLAQLSISGQFIIRPKGSHPEDLFRQMRDAGITRLDCGIESGSPQVRDHMVKKFSNSDIDWHLEMCEKYNIQNWLLLLIGYPTETEQDFQMTLDMMYRYQKYLVNETVLGLNIVNTLMVLPNSPLWEMSEDLMLEHDNLDHFKWISRKNSSLTMVERTRRWIRATETAMDLGYPLPVEIGYSLEKQYEMAVHHNTVVDNSTQQSTPTRRIIPIASEVYN